MTLVSNLKRSGSDFIPNISLDYGAAQAFTTGGHELGYRITHVQLYLRVASDSPSPVVTIREGNGGTPSGGSTLYTFDPPPDIFENPDDFQLYTFTATSTSTDTLARNITYWLRVEVKNVGFSRVLCTLVLSQT